MTLFLSLSLLAGVTLSPPEPVSLSYYGAEYVGRTMYSGRRYNPSEPVCASPDRPMGARLVVCHEGRCAGCVVADRMITGPYLDASSAVFERLAPLSRGRIAAQVSSVTLP